jgi:hypothetical protein
MELESDSGRAKAHLDVLVVAEGLVPRLAAAQRGAGQHVD